MSGRLGFFEQQATANAVFRFASKTTDLTLFVGLGASLASQLPSWSDFARGVVEELAASTNGLQPAEAAAALLEAEDLLAAMEIARASWPPQQFEAAMVKSLYGGPPVTPERAISHEAIAELAVEWVQSNPSSTVTILTTNYDLLIERALHRLTPSTIEPEQLFGSAEVLDSGRKKPRKVWTFSLGCPVGGVVATPAGNSSWLSVADSEVQAAVRVVHLHGILTPEDSQGHLVATTSDYYRDDKAHGAARKLVERALNQSTCLFMGTSLSDPLVLSHLHNAGDRRSTAETPHRPMEPSPDGLHLPYEPHWRVPSAPLAAVIFSRETFSWAVDPDLEEQSKRRLEEEYSAMWRQLRLAVIWSDFYGQPYQMLREVAFTRRLLAADGYFAKKWPNAERPSEKKVERARLAVEPFSYGKRIDRWADLFIEELQIPSRHIREPCTSRDLTDRMLWQQREIRRLLTTYRDRAMQHLLNVQDPMSRDEEWKLDLWVRSPARHALVRVASTQYEFLTGPGEAVPYPLNFQSNLPAVRAFANGATTGQKGYGRWRYYLAVPVRQTPEVPTLSLDEAQASRAVWGDVPVGALVLSTSETPDSSVLFTRSSAKRRDVSTLLQVAGNEIVSFGAEDRF